MDSPFIDFFVERIPLGFQNARIDLTRHLGSKRRDYFGDFAERRGRAGAATQCARFFLPQ